MSTHPIAWSPLTRAYSTRARLGGAVALATLGVARRGLAPAVAAGKTGQMGETSVDVTTAIWQAPPDLSWQQMAEAAWTSLRDRYYLPEFGLFREHDQPRGEDNAFSYLWPYCGVLSAANALAAMPAGGEAYAEDLRSLLTNLEQYWDPDGLPPAYDSYVVEFGGGQKYYDDNEWLGLDFVTASRTLGDTSYLDKADAMLAFALSGWSDDLDGGIWWREGDRMTKNTCSNAPAAVLALMLYEETGDNATVEWATRILDWTAQLKDPATGVYFDHPRADGTVDRRKFTYNVGTPLHANALLFRITGEERYLMEARALAAASLDWFAPEATGVDGTDLPFFPNTPWFNAVLFRGYLALEAVDPAPDRRYADAMLANVGYAWEHARTDTNLFLADWSGRVPDDDGYHWLLDQAPIVEICALAASRRAEIEGKEAGAAEMDRRGNPPRLGKREMGSR
ncbi:MAG: glycoside hydrolase family 76 protein [Thermomicrobiales bacterium]